MLLVTFAVILILVLKNGEAGRAVKQALGWRRPDRVALLTVATHLARLAETVDTESGGILISLKNAISLIKLILILSRIWSIENRFLLPFFD